jgi:hypothetical protein
MILIVLPIFIVSGRSGLVFMDVMGVVQRRGCKMSRVVCPYCGRLKEEELVCECGREVVEGVADWGWYD